MEGINAALCIGTIFTNTGSNPTGTICCNTTNRRSLFFCESFKKLGQDFTAETNSTPDYGVCIVIHNYSHILVSLLIAGFIDADIDKVVNSNFAP